MSILDDYLVLARLEQWEEALPLIKRIVASGPHISTSWRNYGVCLDALGRHADAAEAFQKSLSIEDDDGALYRAFRSLALAEDQDGFLRLLNEQSLKTSGLFELIDQDEVFSNMRDSYFYEELKRSRG